MRKVTIWMGAVAVVALTAGCGSNHQRSNDSSGKPAAAGTSGAAEVNGGRGLTLRGCLEDGVPAGTYVLRTNAPVETGGAAGTSGSNKGAGESEANGARSGRNLQAAGLYRLIATGNLDFGQNLGKEVTVTGEIARQSYDNTVGTTGPAGGPDKRQGASGGVAGGASDQTGGARFLRVTSMNKVSDSCEGR